MGRKGYDGIYKGPYGPPKPPKPQPPPQPEPKPSNTNSTMDGTQVPAPTTGTEQLEKKRLRKGTHSCWECKRRKRRCIFDGQDNRACTGCRRRGLPCLGQEVPETLLLARKGRSEISEQLSRVESILQDVMDKVSSAERDAEQASPPSVDGRHSAEMAEPAEPARPVATTTPTARHQTPTLALLAAFPGPEDYQTLMASSQIIDAFIRQTTTGERTDMERFEHEATSHASAAHGAAAAAPLPDATAHPVLVARQMLFWALFLQSPWHHRVCVFREDVWTLMQRLVAATRCVNNNDDLHGSLESLQCMMLEAQYHLNLGNLRRTWVVNRRAMLLAQMMGVNRADSSSRTRPRLRTLVARAVFQPDHMWSCILYLDRFLCLLLGLPQGTCEVNFVPCNTLPVSLDKVPTMKLQSALSSIAARILERQEHGLAPSARLGPEHDPAVLDAELLRLAQALPAEYWQLPQFDRMEWYSLQDSVAVFRLLVQVYYFLLLNQLHLPYMLSFIRCASSTPAAPAMPATATANEYAAISCTRASREILQRFLAYRNFNHTTMCFRQVDFAAVTAILTLLLAHLDVHLAANCARLRAAAGGAATAAGDGPATPSLAHKLLAQQRLADRALLEQVLERLDFVSDFNRDTMSSDSSQMMRTLLTIEAQAAGDYRADPPGGKNTLLQITIPYFGAVCVTWDGRISQVFPVDDGDDGDDSENSNSDAAPAPADTDHGHVTTKTDPERSHWAKCVGRAPAGVIFYPDEAAVLASPASFSSLPPLTGSSNTMASSSSSAAGTAASSSSFLPGLVPQQPVSPPMPSIEDGSAVDLADSWGPAIAAGTDTWAMQGVDMAFFEHIMMEPLGQPW